MIYFARLVVAAQVRTMRLMVAVLAGLPDATDPVLSISLYIDTRKSEVKLSIFWRERS